MKVLCECDFCKTVSPDKATHKLCANKMQMLVADLKKQIRLKKQWKSVSDAVLTEKYGLHLSTLKAMKRKIK